MKGVAETSTHQNTLSDVWVRKVVGKGINLLLIVKQSPSAWREEKQWQLELSTIAAGQSRGRSKGTCETL